MYICSRVFTTLSYFLFPSPCCCFEGSVVRGFAVGNGALFLSSLSLSLSRRKFEFLRVGRN